jgi:hypothetical protein
METQIKSQSLPHIIPINDETRAMLDYASSPEGCAKIENGRREIREGKGITGTPGFFVNLSQRISGRVAHNRAA